MCRFCFGNSLNKKLVKGKIVLCEGRTAGLGPLLSDAAGAVTQGQNFRDAALSFPLPGSYLSLQDGVDIFFYINSSRYQLNATFMVCLEAN